MELGLAVVGRNVVDRDRDLEDADEAGFGPGCPTADVEDEEEDEEDEEDHDVEVVARE